MASSSTNFQLTVLDIFYVAPYFESPESATQFSLPLTFFDVMWYKFPPVEYIFFYKHDGLTLHKFNSDFVPRLKHSLSLTLSQFLPLAGNITWQENASVPSLLCSPGDAVSVKIAESDADFAVVSSKNVHEAALSHLYVTELPVSDTKASTIALQLTLFPNQGFCIGITSHHAILDGKSATMFLKAWAYMCKNIENGKRPRLPPELTPFMDRKAIKDPERLDMEFLNLWFGVKGPNTDTNNPRSLKLLPSVITARDLVRATFVLSRDDVRNLRGMIMSYLTTDQVQNEDESLYLSTFVLSFAYATVCIAKAKDLAVRFVFLVDCRSRSDPPIHENYFGNCVTARSISVDYSEGNILENIVIVTKKLSQVIKGLDKGVVTGIKEVVVELTQTAAESKLAIGVAGSIKFGFYEIDFGWGKPVLMQLTSIDRTGAISMAESKEESGGVEIGVVLQKHEMEKFACLFVDGIKDP